MQVRSVLLVAFVGRLLSDEINTLPDRSRLKYKC